MSIDKQEQFKKLMTLKDEPLLAVFDEIQLLNESLKEVIQTIQDTKTESVRIENLDEIKYPEIPEISLDSLKDSIDKITNTIPKVKDIDLSGIEKLLSKISQKKDKLDLKELSNISSILGSILYAAQSTAQSVSEKQETEKLIPELSKIQGILNVLNENLVSFNVPEFDYEKLAKIIKNNLTIKVNGGANMAGTEAGLASLLTELQLKADLTETQPVSAASLPLPTGAATETTLAKIPGLSVPIHDYISLGYTGSNLTSVVYKTGGSGGTTVATLTLAYSGSTLTSVTKT